MSEDFQLDEIREDKWQQMAHDVGMYCRKNEAKFQAAAQCLLQEKTPAQKAKEWLKLQQQMALGKMNIWGGSCELAWIPTRRRYRF